MRPHLQRVGCVSYLIDKSCGVQVRERQCRVNFFLTRNAGRVSGRVKVSLKCNWAR